MANDNLNRVIRCVADVFAAKGKRAPALDGGTILDKSLGLESLDYAELIVRLEAEFGADPFDAPNPPAVRTIADLASLYA